MQRLFQLLPAESRALKILVYYLNQKIITSSKLNTAVSLNVLNLFACLFVFYWLSTSISPASELTHHSILLDGPDVSSTIKSWGGRGGWLVKAGEVGRGRLFLGEGLGAIISNIATKRGWYIYRFMDIIQRNTVTWIRDHFNQGRYFHERGVLE